MITICNVNMLIGVATPQMVCTWQIQAVHILYTLGLQSPLTCHIDILSVSYKYNNLLATHTTPRCIPTLPNSTIAFP